MTDTQKTLLAQQTRFETNRIKFSDNMDAITRGQRGGLFSIPLGNTIGDSSTYYMRDRKNAEEVGKKSNFSNGRGRVSTTQPFNKLVSNAIGDPYQDGGRYFLRNGSGSKAHSGPFNPSGNGNKILGRINLTEENEFKQHHAGPSSDHKKWLATKTHCSSF